MGSWRTRQFLILCALFALIAQLAPVYRAQKLTEEEPLEGSGRYAGGPNPDDEDFSDEGSGASANAARTVRPPAGGPPTAPPSNIHRPSSPYVPQSPGDETRRPLDASHTPSDASGHEAGGGPSSSTYIVVGVVALVCVLAITIVAVTCCCSRRRRDYDYTPASARSKSYV